MIEYFDVDGLRVANIKNDSNIAFFGIAVLAGSNYETPDIAGISHYAEHVFFKGTKRRNWNQINQEFAKLGVSNNAYTSNSEVIYHATCPKENIPSVVDLMMDMFFNSTYSKKEIENERTVIIEEKKMYEDDPKMFFNSEIGNSLFRWSLGHDTIGTFDTIKSIGRKEIIQYLHDKVNLSNFIFIFCGDVKTDLLKKCISKGMVKNHPYLKKDCEMNSVDGVGGFGWSELVLNGDHKVKLAVERPNITQSVVSMLSQGISVDSPCYPAYFVATKCLGGGAYSDFFVRIREQLGLCYSVGVANFAIDYPRRTITEVYGYLAPENVDRFMVESEKLIRKNINNGLNKDVFECAKTDCLSGVLRSTETSSGKATFLARRLLVNKTASLEEYIQKLRKVTIEDSNDAMREFMDTDYYWAMMNPKKRGKK